MHFRLPESLAHDARRPLRLDRHQVLLRAACSRTGHLSALPWFADSVRQEPSPTSPARRSCLSFSIKSRPSISAGCSDRSRPAWWWLRRSTAACRIAIPLWRVLRTANTVQLGAGSPAARQRADGLWRHVERFRLRLHLRFRAGLRVSQRIGHRDDAPRRDRRDRFGVARHQSIPDRGRHHYVPWIHRQSGAAHGAGDRRIGRRVHARSIS